MDPGHAPFLCLWSYFNAVKVFCGLENCTSYVKYFLRLNNLCEFYIPIHKDILLSCDIVFWLISILLDNK